MEGGGASKKRFAEVVQLDGLGIELKETQVHWGHKSQRKRCPSTRLQAGGGHHHLGILKKFSVPRPTLRPRARRLRRRRTTLRPGARS